MHQKVKIKGIHNIIIKSKLQIGLGDIGFSHKSDLTFFNIEGKIIFNGDYFIGRGCRINIGKNGVVEIGWGGYINCNTSIIIMNFLKIGNNCIIAWNCEFLDDDFHQIFYDNKKKSMAGIQIGNDVWIGSGVKIFKGTTISDGSVIASNSIVRGQFEEKNVLIAGHPARVIKREINWI